MKTADAAKAAAWDKFVAACVKFTRDNACTADAQRALADAACEYAGKRVERHVAAEREACALLVERMADSADMAGGLATPKQHRLHEAAYAIRARSS